MNDKEKIKKLEDRCNSLARENFRFRQEQKDYHLLSQVLPKDKRYVQYLMVANASLERQIEEQQRNIDKYQKHYARYGKFYTEWELSTGTHKDDIEL